MNKPDYANWVPRKIPIITGICSAVCLALLAASFLPQANALWVIVRFVLAAASALCLFFFVYMSIARHLLSYDGGGVQGKNLDNVLRYLDWNGGGSLLDIGCGSGAMTIKAAKKFPRGAIVGMDYWGAAWDYAQSQCERNAELEGVSERVTFRKGDAAKLDFADATFDAAVSNFVFHEVRTQPDKLALIREALRVLKPGGAFSFSDVYYSKSVYKDIDALVRALSADVSEIHFVDTRKNDFTPKFLQTPLIMGEMGLIYGKK